MDGNHPLLTAASGLGRIEVLSPGPRPLPVAGHRPTGAARDPHSLRPA